MAEPRAEISKRSGSLLKGLVKASGEMLKESRTRGEDAMRYYRAHDYDFLYNNVDQDMFFRSCVKKAWEAFTILIGYLTPESPHRSVEYKRTALDPNGVDASRQQMTQSRLGVVEQYLNWSVGETDFAKHVRRVVLDFIARGRGVMWTGIHPNKDVITSVWDSELNYGVDPNALTDEDVMWKSRTMVMPRSRAIQMYPNSKKLLKMATKCGERFDLACSSIVNNKLDTTLDCIKLHTIYMRNAITEYGDAHGLREAIRQAGVSEDSMEAQLLSPRPIRYTVTDDGMLVDASEWEVPLWRDGLWPCTELVAYDDNSSMTPISPIDAAIKFTHAINWLSSLMLGKARMTMRMVLANVKHNGQGMDQNALARVMLGKDMESIELNAFGDENNADINKWIQTIRWDNSWISPMISLIQFYENKFDEMSGISQIMRTGEAGTQDRSAEATRLRREVSFNRVDDMKNAVAHFQDEVARKEGIYLQYLKGSDYIANIFGNEAAMAYGFLGSKEDQDPGYWMEKLTEQGVILEEAEKIAVNRAMRAYTIDDILREANYTTTVGEGPRKNRQARLDAYDRMLNQTAPTMMQTGDPADAAIVLDVQADFFEDVGLPQKTVQKLRDRAEQLREMAMQMQQQAQMQQMQQPMEGAPVEG